MADEKTKETKGEQFCEYQYVSGEWILMHSHTHEGYYCGYYEGDNFSPPEEGDTEDQPEKRAYPSATKKSGHRRYGIYKLEVDEVKNVTAVPVHKWTLFNQDRFPQDLFGELVRNGQRVIAGALADAARQAPITLEVAMSEEEIRGTDVYVGGADFKFNPDLGSVSYTHLTLPTKA